MKLIILDRDGVINHDRDDFVKSAEECVPIDGSIEAIARLHKAGYTVVVATNQSGLAKGLFDLDDLEAMHEKITQLVLEAEGELGAIFYCPHADEDNCKCRKPQPGMLEAIEAEFNTSVESCYFIGDKIKDLQAGASKGCKPLLVLTGKGAQAQAQLQAEDLAAVAPELTDLDIPVCADLASAVDMILAQA